MLVDDDAVILTLLVGHTRYIQTTSIQVVFVCEHVSRDFWLELVEENSENLLPGWCSFARLACWRRSPFSREIWRHSPLDADTLKQESNNLSLYHAECITAERFHTRGILRVWSFLFVDVLSLRWWRFHFWTQGMGQSQVLSRSPWDGRAHFSCAGIGPRRNSVCTVAVTVWRCLKSESQRVISREDREVSLSLCFWCGTRILYWQVFEHFLLQTDPICRSVRLKWRRFGSFALLCISYFHQRFSF